MAARIVRAYNGTFHTSYDPAVVYVCTGCDYAFSSYEPRGGQRHITYDYSVVPPRSGCSGVFERGSREAQVAWRLGGAEAVAEMLKGGR